MSGDEKSHTFEFVRRLWVMRGDPRHCGPLGMEFFCATVAFLDEKYRNGDWNFSTEDSDLMHLIETYATNGNILALGCGTARIVSFLKPGSFESFVGVDLLARSHRAGEQASKQPCEVRGGLLRQDEVSVLLPFRGHFIPRFHSIGVNGWSEGEVIVPDARITFAGWQDHCFHRVTTALRRYS